MGVGGSFSDHVIPLLILHFHSCSLYKLAHIDSFSFTAPIHDLDVLIPIFQTRKLKLKRSGRFQRMNSLVSNTERIWARFSASTKVHGPESHPDSEGHNPDPPEPLWPMTLPLHLLVLDVEGILRLNWSHFSFIFYRDYLSFRHVFTHKNLLCSRHYIVWGVQSLPY